MSVQPVCTYIHMRIHMYPYTYMMNVHVMYVHSQCHLGIYVYIFVDIRTYVYIRTYVHRYFCMATYTVHILCTYVYVHLFVYIYTCVLYCTHIGKGQYYTSVDISFNTSCVQNSTLIWRETQKGFYVCSHQRCICLFLIVWCSYNITKPQQYYHSVCM